MNARTVAGKAGSTKPKPGEKPPLSTGLVIPPASPGSAEATRAAARAAAERLAKMTPEEQAAALFHSMGNRGKA